MSEQILDISAFIILSFVKVNYMINIISRPQIMRNNYDCESLSRVVFFDVFKDIFAMLKVKVAGRFVQDNKLTF